MKRRKSSGAYRKERIIMIASSVLVLTAMTVTGVYIYNDKEAKEPENNVVDFSALEDGGQNQGGPVAQADNNAPKNVTSGQKDAGELDYDPFYEEADRKLNGQQVNAKAEKAEADNKAAGQAETADGQETSSVQTARDAKRADETETAAENTTASPEGLADAQADGDEEDVADAGAEGEEDALEAVADAIQEESNLHFDEAGKLEWPITGNVLINYSMDKTVFFQTLQQYKYNPSIVIGATQGTNVACAADGIVKSVYKDPQTGTTVVMNLGDGYELTYGQLMDVAVEEGDFVESGVFIGKVAAPTKYYTVEGTNVFFKLTKDGEPVNPLNYLG